MIHYLLVLVTILLLITDDTFGIGIIIVEGPDRHYTHSHLFSSWNDINDDDDDDDDINILMTLILFIIKMTVSISGDDDIPDIQPMTIVIKWWLLFLYYSWCVM